MIFKENLQLQLIREHKKDILAHLPVASALGMAAICVSVRFIFVAKSFLSLEAGIVRVFIASIFN